MMPYNQMNEISLADAVRFVVDNRGKTAPTEKIGIPLIATNCISNAELYPTKERLRYVSDEIYANWFRAHPEPGDIILTNKGSQNGAVCLVPDPVDFCIAQDMVALRADESKIDPLYLFAALRSTLVQNRIKNLNVDAVIPHLKKTDFNKLFIPLPDKKTQETIGKFYFDFSVKIELNRQINQTLEQIAQTIFKSWFVDFEPVKAKIAAKTAGHDPDRAAMCAISGKTAAELDQLTAEQRQQLAATAALFPDELVESELGLVPVGWSVSTLGKYCDILNGHAFKSKDYVTEGIFVFRTKNFSDSGYSERLSDDVFLPRTFCDSHSKFLCRPFDFHLVMVAASIGKTAVIFPHHLPALRNQNMWCFRAKENFSSKIYLQHTVSRIVKELLGWASGSARSFFRKGDFQQQMFLFPDSEILACFENTALSTLNKISTNNLESAKLSQLRDSMLPKLLSGELPPLIPPMK